MTTQRAILTALDRCCTPTQHLAVPELTVQADVNLILPTPVTLSTLRRELAQLESGQQIVSVQDDDRGTLWKITAQGRARLAE